MKEIYDIPKPPETPVTPTRFRPISKRWKSVSNASHPNKLKQQIDCRIGQYELVLGKVKELYKGSGEVCYERNFKDDNENPFTIYSFLTNTFFWAIECDFTYNMNVFYQFDGCPYEHDIKALFKRFGINSYVIAVNKQPTLLEFYKGVLAYQKPQYIHTL